ncbi:MAG: 6-phosphofructokinase, alpha subunit [Watsoniomyces obsoletus]|nr:MAG: 6-phosphofructokinase, alpha subunit [Watsoniomyces obsoletus]
MSSTFGYTQAQALVFSKHGEPSDVLRLHRYSIPPAYSTNLTLRFLASPINPADINQIQGTYPTRPTFTSALSTPSPIAVGGMEGLAEVISVGGQVKSLQKGDWVLMRRPGFGTWRTHASVSSAEEDLLPISSEDHEGISPLQLSTLSINPVTAHRLLRDFIPLDPERGDWFIQNGANSAVGRIAIQLGKIWGYKSINIIRNRSQDELELLKQELYTLGANMVITEDELLNDTRGVSEKIHDATNQGKEKVKLGLNCVGGKSATALARILADDGCLVTYGAMSKQPLILPAGLLIFKNVRCEGFWVSRWAQKHPDQKMETLRELLGLLKKGELTLGPMREVEWSTSGGERGKEGWEQKEERLKGEVQMTLDGYRGAKSVLLFNE